MEDKNMVEEKDILNIENLRVRFETEDGVVYADVPNISIHTPIKGVTNLRCIHNDYRTISIHTPIKGVTIIFYGILTVFAEFQSTHP